MKQTILSLIALLVLTLPGYAGPVDSLTIISSERNYDGRGQLDYFDDGEDPSAFDPNGASGASSGSLTAMPKSRTIPNAVVGIPKKVTFTLTGKSLKNPITLSTISEPVGGEFSVYPQVLPATGGTVTVTFKALSAGNSSAVITFKSGNKSVKLTVTTFAKSVIKTSNSSLHFPDAVSKSLKVTCDGANSGLILTPQGTGAQYFSFPRTISKTDARKGKNITVKCTASSKIQRASAQIVISGGGADPKTVYLSYVKGQDVRVREVKPEDEPGDVIYGGELEAATETWGNSITAVDELTANVNIFAEGQEIIIDTPEEQNATISDLAGRARNVKLQAGRNVIPVNESGIYIVRIREKTTKLMLR